MSAPQFNESTTAAQVADFYKSEIAGKNVLITGVSPTSLGEETVKALAPYAKTIIIASRTLANVNKVVAGVKQVAPQANLVPIEVDLSSPDSVKQAATSINDLKIPIHFVLNNAGVTSARYPELTKTKEGSEIQFAANHLGHFLLNSRIFSSIKAAHSAGFKPRIVTVSSIGHALFPARLDDLNFEKRPEEYTPFDAYGSSKLANVLYARGLAKRYPDTVLAYSLHPGNILETGMAQAGKSYLIELGFLEKDGSKRSTDPWKTLEEGAATTVYAALSPSITGDSGAYLFDCTLAEEKASDASKASENVEILWETSERLIGEKFGQ